MSRNADIDIRVISLDQKPSPAILASLLGITEPMIYKYRETGKLPSRISASYQECLTHHIEYLKKQAAGKAGTILELKMEKETRKIMAQEEEILLNMKIRREQYGDYKELKELFEPIFMLIQSNLVNISRKFPETMEEIDNAIDTLNSLGVRIADKAEADGNAFIKEMLERDLSLEAIDKELRDNFGLDVEDYTSFA